MKELESGIDAGLVAQPDAVRLRLFYALPYGCCARPGCVCLRFEVEPERFSPQTPVCTVCNHHSGFHHVGSYADRAYGLRRRQDLLHYVFGLKSADSGIAFDMQAINDIFGTKSPDDHGLSEEQSPGGKRSAKSDKGRDSSKIVEPEDQTGSAALEIETDGSLDDLMISQSLNDVAGLSQEPGSDRCGSENSTAMRACDSSSSASRKAPRVASDRVSHSDHSCRSPDGLSGMGAGPTSPNDSTGADAKTERRGRKDMSPTPSLEDMRAVVQSLQMGPGRVFGNQDTNPSVTAEKLDGRKDGDRDGPPARICLNTAAQTSAEPISYENENHLDRKPDDQPPTTTQYVDFSTNIKKQDPADPERLTPVDIPPTSMRVWSSEEQRHGAASGRDGPPEYVPWWMEDESISSSDSQSRTARPRDQKSWEDETSGKDRWDEEAEESGDDKTNLYQLSNRYKSNHSRPLDQQVHPVHRKWPPETSAESGWRRQNSRFRGSVEPVPFAISSPSRGSDLPWRNGPQAPHGACEDKFRTGWRASYRSKSRTAGSPGLPGQGSLATRQRADRRKRAKERTEREARANESDIALKGKEELPSTSTPTEPDFKSDTSRAEPLLIDI